MPPRSHEACWLKAHGRSLAACHHPSRLVRATWLLHSWIRITGSRFGRRYGVALLSTARRCRAGVVWFGKASTTWPDAAKSPPLLAARSHYVQPPGHAPREPSQTTICVACLLSRVLLVCARYASCVARVWMRCVGRASKLECRVLCIVVIYHLYTRGSLGCDGAARGSRRRDRPFRH